MGSSVLISECKHSRTMRVCTDCNCLREPYGSTITQRPMGPVLHYRLSLVNVQVLLDLRHRGETLSGGCYVI